jgi:arabinose-5-phosphate isomerase
MLEEARRVIDSEIAALKKIPNLLGDGFEKLIRGLYRSKGTVILCGMGKSGLIAQKITATLVSTGTRAIFLHPSEAVHGDIGIVSDDDFIIALSHSGETNDMLRLLPHFRRQRVKIACITAKPRSSLAQLADITILYPDEAEACPLELAPMKSTTCMLVLGDAIAACLMVKKKFTREDFGLYHPSGSLGKELVATVDSVMIKDKLPLLSPNANLKKMISEMCSSNVGAVLIHENKKLLGIISDGDIKRILNKASDLNQPLHAADIMTKNPVSLYQDELLKRAVEMMRSKVIYVLPVINRKNDKIIGLLRLHDILSYNP